jgi:hypothetical protein
MPAEQEPAPPAPPHPPAPPPSPGGSGRPADGSGPGPDAGGATSPSASGHPAGRARTLVVTATIAGAAGIVGTLAVAHLVGDSSPTTTPAGATSPVAPSTGSDRSGPADQSPVPDAGRSWSATPGSGAPDAMPPQGRSRAS